VNKLKIGTAIFIGWLFLQIMLLLVIIACLYYANMINSEVKTVITENTAKINLGNTLAASIKDEQQNIYAMLLITNGQAKMEQYNMLKKNQAKYDQAWAMLLKIKPTAEEQALHTRIINCRQSAEKIINRIIEPIAIGNQAVMDQAALTQIDQEVNKWIGLLEQNIQSNNIANEKAKTNAAKIPMTFISVILITILIGMLSALIFWVNAYRNITGPVNRTTQGLTESSKQVAAVSSQLATSAQQLSAGSTEQAAAIEETSSTLEESASMLQQNTASTKQATQISQQAKDSADKGNNEMQEMMASIREIKKSSNQIAKIIKIIDDIAFQTNILALNAAVEAARAGEAGMGFAVVAEEVRNLAQRSAQAAKDTATIIETNIELSGQGVAVADRVREALNEITIQAKKVNELMAEIAAGSQEQTQGINQVSKAINQMETVTQQNAASAEENAITSQELMEQANNMKKMLQDISRIVYEGNYTLMGKSSVKDKITVNSGDQPDTSLAKKKSKKTKVVSPEDVIPLEKDLH
jgi:methyl-accepting chemotaxis protein